MMSEKANRAFFQKKLGSLFASFAILSFGLLSFLNSFSLSGNSVLYVLSIILPAALCLGFVGYLIGRIFDNKKNHESFNANISIKNRENNNQDPYLIQSMFNDDQTVEVEEIEEDVPSEEPSSEAPPQEEV